MCQIVAKQVGQKDAKSIKQPPLPLGFRSSSTEKSSPKRTWLAVLCCCGLSANLIGLINSGGRVAIAHLGPTPMVRKAKVSCECHGAIFWQDEVAWQGRNCSSLRWGPSHSYPNLTRSVAASGLSRKIKAEHMLAQCAASSMRQNMRVLRIQHLSCHWIRKQSVVIDGDRIDTIWVANSSAMCPTSMTPKKHHPCSSTSSLTFCGRCDLYKRPFVCGLQSLALYPPAGTSRSSFWWWCPAAHPLNKRGRQVAMVTTHVSAMPKPICCGKQNLNGAQKY